MVESQHHVKDFEPENIPTHLFLLDVFIWMLYFIWIPQIMKNKSSKKHSIWEMRHTQKTEGGKETDNQKVVSILYIIVQKLQEKLE